MPFIQKCEQIHLLNANKNGFINTSHSTKKMRSVVLLTRRLEEKTLDNIFILTIFYIVSLRELRSKDKSVEIY